MHEAQRCFDDYGMIKAHAAGVGDVLEELWCGVWEWVAGEGSDDDAVHVVQAAPYGGEGYEDDVASGDVNGFVWSVVFGDGFSRHGPVGLAVEGFYR